MNSQSTATMFAERESTIFFSPTPFGVQCPSLQFSGVIINVVMVCQDPIPAISISISLSNRVLPPYFFGVVRWPSGRLVGPEVTSRQSALIASGPAADMAPSARAARTRAATGGGQAA